MDLHQRPYSAGPQQYYRTHTTVATSPYHTPPQTHAFTQPLSAHTSAMMGLDLLDCHPNQQLPICGPAPHLHPMALGWSRDTDPINYYSNTPSHLDEYHDLSLYGNMGAIATTGAPLITPHTDTAISSLTAFPSPPTACRKPTYPQTTAEQSSHIQYQASTPRQTATAAKRVKINHDDSPMQDSSTTSLGHNLSSPFGYEAGYPVSTKQSRDTGHMLLEVDNNIKRPADKGAQREARLSTNTAPNATQISCATATRKSGIMKQSRRNTTTGKGKYACPKCGLQFTRNSNCKSHMKIHDPNRKFPHKCTTGQCTKQFSRKTDLVRHVDSVHKKLRKFGCSQCGHHFARQDTLRRHCEDGCRKQNRQGKRASPVTLTVTTTNATPTSTSTDIVPTYAAPSISYQQSTCSPPYRDGNQQLAHQAQHDHNTFMRSAFMGNTYTQYA